LEKAFTEYKASYGYGWFIRDAFGKKTVGHPGGITGFSSFMMRVPEDETFVILLSNCPSPTLAKIDVGINALLNGQEPELP
jgi:CubicO group peptidase (beta-lactamase class C family)